MKAPGGGSLRDTSIGLVASDWEMGVVGDFVAALQAGVSVNAVETDTGCAQDEVGVLKTSAVLRGKFFPAQHKVVVPEDVERVATSVVADRVIISRMNTPALVGESGYVIADEPNLFLPDRLWQTEPSLRPHSQRWLAYWLQHPSIRRLIASGATGTSNSMKNISKETVLSLPIPRTPLPEQQKIAAILTAVDDKLDVIARQIDSTQTLKQGLMRTLFSRGVGTQGANGRWVPHSEFKHSELGQIPARWEVLKLGGIVRSFAGGTPDRSTPDYFGGDIPWVKSGEVNRKTITFTEEFITPLAVEETSVRVAEKGAILVAMYGATAGKVSRLMLDAAINQAILSIRSISAKCTNDYLYWSICNQTERMIAMCQGAAQPNLSKGLIESLLIVVPDIHEQMQISKTLFSVDSKLDALAEKQAKFLVLKRGLMQKLLTGEWRARLDASATET